MSDLDRAKSSSWGRYLNRFHNERPGITEVILAAATADNGGTTAYRWLLNGAPTGCLALDVACGSAPLAKIDTDRCWIGIDRSSGELADAARHEQSYLVQGEAGALPFPDESFGLVVCSMALMLFDSVDVVLTEIRRVLVPTGTVIFLLPGSRPLRNRDRLRYLQLLAALRQFQPAYPNRVHLAGLWGHLARAGLKVVNDERRRFRYPITDAVGWSTFHRIPLRAGTFSRASRSCDPFDQALDRVRAWNPPQTDRMREGAASRVRDGLAG